MRKPTTHGAGYSHAEGVVLMLVLAVLAGGVNAATYYVSNAGSDANDGKSPQKAWAALDRVNSAVLAPGDKVLFRRGDQWRGSLSPKSGSEAGPVLYGAYGTGPKPVLLGSVAKSKPEDWRQEGGNIWVAGERKESRPPVLPPVSADRALPWGLFTEGGAQATCAKLTGADATPGGYTVACTASGKNGSDMQLSTTGLRLEDGKCYRLAFRARSTQPFTLRMPVLMMTNSPWTGYSSGPALAKARMEPEAQVCEQFYRALKTAPDGRLTFYLGGALFAGATLTIDQASFTECREEDVPKPDPGALPVDVGNIIFNDGQACGVKVWNESDLKQEGQYWYDEDRQLVKLVMSQNPATRYQSIECALHRHIINQGGCGYVIYENLALKYGGAHGVGGGSTHHIIVRDCDLSWIGGADQMGGDKTVRYGNGIEFWGAAHDNLVERCRLWEIYDAALTNQNAGATVEEVNITYRQNLIWNCEYSFEYWNRPEASVTRNIVFEHNTCVNAGHGWGHAQRPDPSGRHLCFYTSDAKAENIVVRNNIFCEAVTNAFYAPTWPKEWLAALVMDRNCWLQQSGVMINLKGHSYPMADFAKYQTEQGMEPHSLCADPLFVDAARLDFRLKPNSPCLPDIGANGLLK